MLPSLIGNCQPKFGLAPHLDGEIFAMRQIFKPILISSACALALGLAVIVLPEIALAQVSVSITLAPPALPEYEQPILVEEGAIWAPGYWAYNQDGYFWVPGTWVQPPEVGLLWTPGYWGWGNEGFAWNAGYWGPTVGFYGGIAYGYGYFGQGYSGGHWQGQHFYYNTAVSHVNVTNIHNVYQQPVSNTTGSRVSFNGGRGGIAAQPTATEQAAARAPHKAATAVQMQHQQAAMGNKAASASVNHGKPTIAATPRPVERAPPIHAAELPAVTHQAVRSTGNVARDQANQQDRDELSNNQEKQRQELQQRQAADHEQAAKQPAARANTEALERQHQAQTQAMAERHTVEQKTLQQTQEARPVAKHEEPHPSR